MKNFTVELTADVAWETAQLLKRLSFETILSHVPAGPDAERRATAYAMVEGVEAIRKALAEAGVSPR